MQGKVTRRYVGGENSSYTVDNASTDCDTSDMPGEVMLKNECGVAPELVWINLGTSASESNRLEAARSCSYSCSRRNLRERDDGWEVEIRDDLS